ncbi:MAG: hypothetical protein ACM336_09455 [Acidobacteriota bacterium]
MIFRPGFVHGRPRGASRPCWYVDSANGDDANSGRSPASALRSIGAAQARLSAGDTLALARGSHWREQLTIPAEGIEVEAYGAGDKPLLDASDVIDPAAWTKTPGFEDVYEAVLPVLQMGTQTFPGLWEDGVWLGYRTSTAAVDAEAGTYFPAGLGGEPASPMTVYIHTSDGSDPRTNGRRYEYSRREAGLKSRFPVKVSGVHTRRNCATPGSLIVGPNSHVEDCLASDGTFHNVYACGGCYLKNVEARNAYHYDSLAMFVFFDDAAAGEDITLEDCWAHMDSIPGPIAQSPLGFYGHSAAGIYGTITYRRCRTTGLNSGLSAGNAARCVLDGCTVEGAQWPYSVNCAESEVTGCSAVGGPISRVLSTNNGTGLNITVRNFALVDSPEVGCEGFFAPGPDVSLDISDSTFGPIAWSASAARAKLRCHRMTFRGTYYYYMDVAPVDAFEVESDYNHFDANGNGLFRWRGVEYTLGAWRAATGQDIHSEA